jgi:activator of HSP90 ATPase
MGIWYEKCDMCGELFDLAVMVRYRGYDRNTGEPEPDNIWRWVDKKCHAWAEKYGQDLADEHNRINS